MRCVRFFFVSLTAAVFAGCATGSSSEKVQSRFVELEGEEAAPYARLADQRMRGRRLILTPAEHRRLQIEVYGEAFAFEAPGVPPVYGPEVLRDTQTGRVVVDYVIGGGWMMFEVAFAEGKPVRVERAYFTDFGREVKFLNVVAMARYKYQQGKRTEDASPRAKE